MFYAIADVAAGTMVLKSHQFLRSARESVELHEADALRRANRAGLDPDSVLAFIDADPTVEEARNLVESRTQQREDWIAFGLFMVLLGGVDAFVSAHLSDFPEPLTVGTLPARDGGPPAVELGVRVPVSWGRR